MDHETDNLQLDELNLNQQAKNGLATGAKWAKFIGIIIIIGAAFMFLGGIGSTIAFSVMPTTGAMASFPVPPVFIGLLYLVFGGLYLWFGLKLMKFSSCSIEAIDHNNSNKLGIALENLGIYFKVIGILIIVFISIYIIAIISIVTMGSTIMSAFPR